MAGPPQSDDRAAHAVYPDVLAGLWCDARPQAHSDMYLRSRGEPEQPVAAQAFRGIILFQDRPQHPDLSGTGCRHRPVGLQGRDRHPARLFRTPERYRTIDRTVHSRCDRRQHRQYRARLCDCHRFRLFERCLARRARPPGRPVSANSADERPVPRLVQRGSGEPQLHHPRTGRGHHGAGRRATHLAHHLAGVGTGNHGAIGLHARHAKRGDGRKTRTLPRARLDRRSRSA